MSKIVYFEKPINIHKVRKTYSENVEFISSTESYPLVSGIIYEGQLHKTIKGKLTSKNVKEKVDRLLESYKQKLYKDWDNHFRILFNELSLTQIEKGGEGSGCHGENCGRPAFSVSEYHEKENPIKNINIQEARPAIRTSDGKVYVGNKGDEHYQIENRHDISQVGHERGFVDSTKKKNWLSREDFKAITGTNLAEDLAHHQQYGKFPKRDEHGYLIQNNLINAEYYKKFEKGGEGSGCNPSVGTCGRPKTGFTKEQQEILDLRPAIKFQGQVYSGKRGDIHADVYDKWLRTTHENKNLYNTPNFETTKGIQTGFVDGKGKFLTRELARTKYGLGESFDLARKQYDIDGQYPVDISEIRHPGLWKDDNSNTKKAIIASTLLSLGNELSKNALDFYKEAYFIGKERGVSISGQDFKNEFTNESIDKINSLDKENANYLQGFMDDLEQKYSNAIDKEYESKEAEEAELQRIQKASESRLNLYVPAILGALAFGITDGVQEANEQSPDKVVTGMVWITQHDDVVCDGCADNDGKFFTFEEFELEYQNNECLTNCRCAESSEPTTDNPDNFARNERLSTLKKGGPGSGCNPDAGKCGRPRRSSLDLIGINPDRNKDYAEASDHLKQVKPYLPTYSMEGAGTPEYSPYINLSEPKDYELDPKVDKYIEIHDISEKPYNETPPNFKKEVHSVIAKYPKHLQKFIGSALGTVEAVPSNILGETVDGQYNPSSFSIEINQEMPKGSGRRKLAITHEFAHALDKGLDRFSTSKEWINTVKEGSPITKYAMHDPHENFAESVTAYLYIPEKLKDANPKAYDVVDKLFKNDVGEFDLRKFEVPNENEVIKDDFKGSLVEILGNLLDKK